MDNSEFKADLEARTKEFAVRIIRFSVTLPSTQEGLVLRNQITKSGTSIGANYREVNHSRSKAEFKSKLSICESEASETQYWLEIVESLGWAEKTELSSLKKECGELLAIFITSGKHSR